MQVEGKARRAPNGWRGDRIHLLSYHHHLTKIMQLPTSQRVELTPIPLASILDHHLRRTEGQDRVFGTLLGYVSPSSSTSNAQTITITGTLGLPTAILGTGELKIDFEDLDSEKTLSLLSRALSSGSGSAASSATASTAASAGSTTASVGNVDEHIQVVGWYATNPLLNSYTPLIHDRYAIRIAATAAASSAAGGLSGASTAALAVPAVHLTLDPETLKFSTYVSATLGVGRRSQNGLFVPVKNKLVVSEMERPTRAFPSIRSSRNTLIDVWWEHTVDMLLSNSATSTSPLTTTSPLQTFYSMLQQLSSMLDAVAAHVSAIVEGKAEGDPKLAAKLYETLGSVVLPKADKPNWEEEFESHLAVRHSHSCLCLCTD